MYLLCVLYVFLLSAYGASPEISFEGKAFKEVDWFRLVDKEMEIVSRVTNTEIQRVRSGLSVCVAVCCSVLQCECVAVCCSASVLRCVAVGVC